MILALLQAGKRVGITANSHKVISNLLEAVCEAAEEAGFRLTALQKGKDEDYCDRREVDQTDKNVEVHDALVDRPGPARRRHLVALGATRDARRARRARGRRGRADVARQRAGRVAGGGQSRPARRSAAARAAAEGCAPARGGRLGARAPAGRRADAALPTGACSCRIPGACIRRSARTLRNCSIEGVSQPGIGSRTSGWTAPDPFDGSGSAVRAGGACREPQLLARGGGGRGGSVRRIAGGPRGRSGG